MTETLRYMETCQELVRTYVATEGGDTLKELVQNVDNQSITLLHIVKALGEYLTNEDGGIREKGIKLLSNTISQCQSERISKQSTRVLTTFYCEKIQDADTVIPALDGLLTLASLPTFGANEAKDTAQSIVKHISMKSLVQSVRYIVFRIIDTLFAKHLAVISSIPSFLPGYIKLAEGEKDPRNLLLAFNIARIITLEFDINNHVDDLKSSLCACLSATPRFGPLALPLFLEKLSATAGNTKRDTLRTMSLCLPVYGPTVAKSFAPQMWSAFKLEIFQPLDTETADKAVNALTTLLSILEHDKAQPSGSAEEGIDVLTEEVITEGLRVLREPEKSQAQHAIKIINACLSTTPVICTYTLNRVVPFLIKQFHDPDEAAHRDPILAALRDILHAARELKDDPCREVVVHFLEANKDATLGALTSGLKATVSRGSALSGLLQLSHIPGVLSVEEMTFVVHSVNDLIGSIEDELKDLRGREVRPIALDVLNVISTVAPKVVEETTLPMLFAMLPDNAPPRDADDERAKYWAILSALAALCEAPTLFEVLVIRLSTKLEIICGSTAADRECAAAYAHALLQTLLKVLIRKADAGHVDVPKYLDRLLPVLLVAVVKSTLSPTPGKEVATHPKILPTIAAIFAIIVRSACAQKQAIFIKSVAKLFFEAHIEGVLISRLQSPCDFHPFEEKASPEQRNTVCLFTASIIPLRPETSLPFENITQTLSALVEWSISDSTSEAQSIAATQLLSSLVNKHTERSKPWLDEYLPNFWQETAYNPRQAKQARIRALRVWVAVTRALAVQNHRKGEEYIDSVFSLFEDPLVGRAAGKAVGEIATNTDGVLTKKNYAAVRLFALQKLCTHLLPRVLLGYKESKDSQLQDAHLVALASLIKAVPKATYVDHLPVLMPILLRGLNLEDTELRTNIFETLLQVTKDTADLGATSTGPLAEHAGSIIKATSTNSRCSDETTPSVQICALRLLAALPSALRYDILHPYKNEVVRKLGSAVDDRRRDVRKEAVDCR
ncbi:ARM repeat-containing protein [Rhizoctonia solani]|nr:ARM repeat-containing protein [Rhizoctonia solani]